MSPGENLWELVMLDILQTGLPYLFPNQQRQISAGDLVISNSVSLMKLCFRSCWNAAAGVSKVTLLSLHSSVVHRRRGDIAQPTEATSSRYFEERLHCSFVEISQRPESTDLCYTVSRRLSTVSLRLYAETAGSDSIRSNIRHSRYTTAVTTSAFGVPRLGSDTDRDESSSYLCERLGSGPGEVWWVGGVQFPTGRGCSSVVRG